MQDLNQAAVRHVATFQLDPNDPANSPPTWSTGHIESIFYDHFVNVLSITLGAGRGVGPHYWVNVCALGTFPLDWSLQTVPGTAGFGEPGNPILVKFSGGLKAVVSIYESVTPLLAAE